MKKIVIFFIFLCIILLLGNIYQYNLNTNTNISKNINNLDTNINNLDTNISKNINNLNNGCNLNFIINPEKLGDFSALLFNKTFILRKKDNTFLCVKSKDMPNGLYIINDFGSEFKVNYKKIRKKIRIISIDNIKYNFIAKEKKYGGKYELFIEGDELLAPFNITSNGIILISKGKKIYSYEVFGNNFDKLRETNMSKEFLECFKADDYLMSIYNDKNISNEGLFKNINIKGTVFDNSRFILKYIYNIKNGKFKKHRCFKLKK